MQPPLPSTARRPHPTAAHVVTTSSAVFSASCTAFPNIPATPPLSSPPLPSPSPPFPSPSSSCPQVVELGPLAQHTVGYGGGGGGGLSTEARKRLTIACELVANPSIVFLVRGGGRDVRAGGVMRGHVYVCVWRGAEAECSWGRGLGSDVGGVGACCFGRL